MTQRIFDTDNKEDMKLLWSILPDWADKITKKEKENGYDIIWNIAFEASHRCLFEINWHDKREITRPINYEDMIGCVGWFWDNQNDKKALSVLLEYRPLTGFPFITQNGSDFSNFTPAKKSEFKFWGED